MTTSKRQTPVSQVMTSEVRTAAPETPLSDIFQLFVNQGCHHVPILTGRTPVGMISSRDLVEVARERGAERMTLGVLAAERADQVMSTDLQVVYADQDIEVAIDRIGRGDLHALVVLDHDDEMVGIITHNDLLRYLIAS